MSAADGSFPTARYRGSSRRVPAPAVGVIVRYLPACADPPLLSRFYRPSPFDHTPLSWIPKLVTIAIDISRQPLLLLARHGASARPRRVGRDDGYWSKHMSRLVLLVARLALSTFRTAMALPSVLDLPPPPPKPSPPGPVPGGNIRQAREISIDAEKPQRRAAGDQQIWRASVTRNSSSFHPRPHPSGVRVGARTNGSPQSCPWAAPGSERVNHLEDGSPRPPSPQHDTKRHEPGTPTGPCHLPWPPNCSPNWRTVDHHVCYSNIPGLRVPPSPGMGLPSWR